VSWQGGNLEPPSPEPHRAMAGTITALRVQQGNRERVSVFVDGEYAFGVSLAVALGLRKGQALTEDEISRLQAADDRERAYQQAVRYLGIRPRSRAELARYLHEKGFAPECAADALARLEQQGYVDDAAFARFWLDNRARFRPRGEQALRHELRQKGVDPEAMEAALSDLDEDAAAWSALEPRLARWQGLEREVFYQKAMGFLARRGFGYTVARSACDRAWAVLAENAS
jgi:regulatory protein